MFFFQDANNHLLGYCSKMTINHIVTYINNVYSWTRDMLRVVNTYNIEIRSENDSI
jgi:hypothetical protein